MNHYGLCKICGKQILTYGEYLLWAGYGVHVSCVKGETMPKTRLPFGANPRPDEWTWPPDIFWITPEGVVVEVIGHMTAMQAHPETFGLDRAPTSKRDVDLAFLDLWSRGWVRGRFSDGKFSFQMERPRGLSLSACYDLVLKFEKQADWVDIDFSDHACARMSTGMHAKDFLQQKFPTSWRLNPRSRR